MRKIKLTALLILMSLLINSNLASASLNGSIDYSNPRVVPFLTSINSESTAGSGFLYSPRLVFTSAHLAYGFDKEGNKIPLVRENYAGTPNTKVTSSSPRVKVIKQFVAPTYRYNEMGALDDFAIFVLEKDLIQIQPAQLMTSSIYEELVSNNAKVSLFGFGHFKDGCSDNQSPPCKMPFESSNEPRSLVATLHKMEEFQNLVGYTRKEFENELLFFTPGKNSMCNGDSGGALTSTYNGNLMYLSNIGTAFRIYACGQSNYDGKGGINYSAPIFRFTELIKEAEKFVKDQIENEKAKVLPSVETKKTTNSKITITCIKKGVSKKITGLKPVCPKGFKKY